MQLIVCEIVYIRAIQLQLCKNNYYAISMQLVCNYCHNVNMMLLFIDSSKFNIILWGFFSEFFFWKYVNFFRALVAK
jgi:hypothetical protein